MQLDRTAEDMLIEVYSTAVDAAMTRANERDGFASNGSRESIVAGLRAVAENNPKARAFDQIVQAFRESIDSDDGIVNDPQDLFELIDRLAIEHQGS